MTWGKWAMNDVEAIDCKRSKVTNRRAGKQKQESDIQIEIADIRHIYTPYSRGPVRSVGDKPIKYFCADKVALEGSSGTRQMHRAAAMFYFC
ncbi:hypothetical protein N7524_008408 [Penicillium chrysogenum]|nr:hypothetical protein N7524_008408 [Penicillium chrysogenum]